METVTLANARKNLYNLIKHVVSDSTPVEISSSKNEADSVIIISKNDWNAIQETLYLQSTGVLTKIKENQNEETEKLEAVDWDSL